MPVLGKALSAPNPENEAALKNVEKEIGGEFTTLFQAAEVTSVIAT
jgi:hypothetical protein